MDAIDQKLRKRSVVSINDMPLQHGEAVELGGWSSSNDRKDSYKDPKGPGVSDRVMRSVTHKLITPRRSLRLLTLATSYRSRLSNRKCPVLSFSVIWLLTFRKVTLERPEPTWPRQTSTQRSSPWTKFASYVMPTLVDEEALTRVIAHARCFENPQG